MSALGEIYGNDKVFPRVAECLYLKGRYVALAYIYMYVCIGERIISRIVPVSFISLDVYDDVHIVYIYTRVFQIILLRSWYSCLHLASSRTARRISRYSFVSWKCVQCVGT